jgi:hypothetical protein
MRRARGRRTAPGRALAAVLLAAALLTLVACSSTGRPPAAEAPAHRDCSGVHLDDVRGPRPSYVDGVLARFANDDAVCRGLWLPTADRWFVPQGLALDGRTAWVSGYRWHRGFSGRACRLLHVSLRTGRLIASTDRIQAEVYGPHLTFCRHGGALTRDRHGLWVVESNRLWLVDPARVGRADQVRRVWRLAPGVRGSVLVDGARPVLGIGAWRDDGPARMWWFRYRDLLAPGVTELVAGGSRRGSPGAGQAAAVRASSTVRRVQGTTRGPGGVWSTSSTTYCGMLVAPDGRRSGFAPGAEGIDLDGHGRLWAVLESGSRPYQREGRPLVPMLVQLDLRTLLRGDRPRCSW